MTWGTYINEALRIQEQLQALSERRLQAILNADLPGMERLIIEQRELMPALMALVKARSLLSDEVPDAFGEMATQLRQKAQRVAEVSERAELLMAGWVNVFVRLEAEESHLLNFEA